MQNLGNFISLLNLSVDSRYVWWGIRKHFKRTNKIDYICAADFSLLNLPKGKSLGRSKPATNY